MAVHPDQQIRFDRFRLDLERERLWDGDQPISLNPKAFEVLRYLVRHPGRRVGKEELLDAVWGERHVTDAVLKVAVREIRKTLGDNARAPRFIETVHRRGYRFIGESSPGATRTRRPSLAAATVVGRDAALADLLRHYESARTGHRQTVFVTGEAGIGKTTLVETFLAGLGDRRCWLTSGYCFEQLGPGEPYQPVLDALGRLCRGPHSAEMVELLRRVAPTWLRQMPTWVGLDERAALERETVGATSQRMVRELAETLEILTADRPLVLVLEDLHWSDHATLTLISFLAQRPDPARLFVIGTHRPADAKLSGHPVDDSWRALQRLPQVHHLPLALLDRGTVEEYLGRRFGEDSGIPRLAPPIHEHTGGNPLFMVSVLEYLESRHRLRHEGERWHLEASAESLDLGVPESIRQLVEQQIDRLDPEDQRVLEAASVSGVEVSSASLAGALGQDLVEIEERCDRLVSRHQFLDTAGVRPLPDGTVAARYAFRHTLHRQVLYERVPQGRRCRLHREIAETGERVFGAGSPELAAELAAHFERARLPDRAVPYLRRAAENAVQRFANREADRYLTRALALDGGDDGGEVRRDLLLQRGRVRRAMGDMQGSADDFGEAAGAAREHRDVEQEVEALLYRVSALYWFRREDCLPEIDRAARRARDLPDRLQIRALGHCAHWNLNLRGWRNEDAALFRAALRAGSDSDDATIASRHLVRNIYFRCWQSDYRGAARWAEEALDLALDAGDAFDYLVGKFFWVWALLHSGRWRRVRSLLARGHEMATRNGHELWALLYQVELAMLHLEAGDAAGALELCAEPLERARRDPQRTGQLLFKSLIMAGLACQALKSWDDGLRHFEEARQASEDRRILMDRLLDLPLHEGLSRHWLAAGDLERARRAARRLCELASPPGERTYRALGLRSLAEIAAAEGRLDEAEDTLTRALHIAEHDDVSLASWRVHATAAAFYRERGQPERAKAHLSWRAALLRRLADRLGPDDPLHATLLARARTGS